MRRPCEPIQNVSFPPKQALLPFGQVGDQCREVTAVLSLHVILIFYDISGFIKTLRLPFSFVLVLSIRPSAMRLKAFELILLFFPVL